MSDPGRRAAVPGHPATYLDHASTSPVRPAVAEAMAPFLHADLFGNASGSHRLARDARRALEDAREEVADLLGREPGEVVFTGGRTESDNLAVFGVARPPGRRPAGRRRAVVCSAVEHAAVLAPATRRPGAAPGCAASSLTLRVAPVDARGWSISPRWSRCVDSERRPGLAS